MGFRKAMLYNKWCFSGVIRLKYLLYFAAFFPKLFA